MSDDPARTTTGMARSSEGLDARRKRLLYRAWHRGTKELDILLGSFADKHVGALDETELDALEKLMQVPEPDLYNWLSGRVDPPDNYAGPLLDRLIAFHKDGGAVFLG